MKKLLLLLPVAASLVVGITACSAKHEWKHEERKATREALREYRDMLYLNDLSDAEFALFIDEVANELEVAYPVYTTFIEMPNVGDTVDMVVVETIVEAINADAHNMRHIFPYSYLVAQGILPAGLDLSQQRQFYNCLAAKVNANFYSVAQFINALLNQTADHALLQQLQGQCANDLFNWTIVVEEVITPLPNGQNSCQMGGQTGCQAGDKKGCKQTGHKGSKADANKQTTATEKPKK